MALNDKFRKHVLGTYPHYTYEYREKVQSVRVQRTKLMRLHLNTLCLFGAGKIIIVNFVLYGWQSYLIMTENLYRFFFPLDFK